MFDLFRSRAKAVRYLLGALLLLVALSMVITLVPGFGSNTGSPNDMVVAEIGKDTLSLPEVQTYIQRRLQGQNLPPEVMPHFVPQIIESMITQRAMAYEAKRLGYQVSDQDVAAAIHQLLPQLFQDGKFAGKEIYAAFLQQQNMTIPQFETELQREMLATKLRDIILEGTVVSPQEVEQEYRRKNEKVKIEYVKLTPDQFKAQVQPAPDALKPYYESHKAAYQIPEKRNLAVLVFDQAKLEQSINPTDADLLKAYNQNKDNFRTPERVKVRHILLKTTDMNAQQEAAVKAKAEDILKQIKGGASFAELAKKNSQDTGSAQNGGELPDWVVRGQTVPEFEKVAFSLPVGQTSDLVKTQYGYHIIQVLAKEAARLKPFDEVKAQIAADYKKQRVNDMMQSIADKAQATLAKNPQNPDQVAAELGAQVVRVNGYTPGTVVPEVGNSPDFDNSVSTLKQNEVSQPVMAPGNKLVLAVAANLVPAHQATFDEVAAQVRDAYVREKTDEMVRNDAAQLAQKTQSMAGDLEKAAKSMGLEVKTSSDFDRQGAVEGLGSASMVSDVFNKPAGAVVGPLTLPDSRVVAKVVSHTPADMSQFAAQRDTIREDLKRQKAQDRNALFEAGLRQALTKQGKIKVHQDVVNRLLANYKG